MSRTHHQRPPRRACCICGRRCYGWSPSSRCTECKKALRELGPVELEPGGLAEEIRRRRLEREKGGSESSVDATGPQV